MLIDVSDVQPSKALGAMDIILFERLIELKEVQPQKTAIPIPVTLFGMLIDFNDEHL